VHRPAVRVYHPDDHILRQLGAVARSSRGFGRVGRLRAVCARRACASRRTVGAADDLRERDGGDSLGDEPAAPTASASQHAGRAWRVRMMQRLGRALGGNALDDLGRHRRRTSPRRAGRCQACGCEWRRAPRCWWRPRRPPAGRLHAQQRGDGTAGGAARRRRARVRSLRSSLRRWNTGTLTRSANVPLMSGPACSCPDRSLR